MSFTIRIFLWGVPVDHEIYYLHKRNLRNITVSNLIRSVMCLKVCPGLPDYFGRSYIEHSVPKVFSLPIIDNSPLFQTKYYRSPSCQILIPSMLENCAGCVKAQTKENLSLKRSRDNLISPAKPKAPIALTPPE